MRLPKILQKTLVLIFTLVTATLISNAQAPPPSSNPPGAPIDGLTSLLLVAGVAYGINRTRKKP